MTETIASYRRRRERERRYEAEEALERRTYRTRNEYGEARHMIGWSREAINKWEEETECKRQRIRQAAGASSVQTSIPVATIRHRNKRWNWRAMMLLLLAFVLTTTLFIACVRINPSPPTNPQPSEPDNGS